MLSGQTLHGKRPKDSALLKKILISLVVIVAVGAAALVVKVAVSHDRLKDDLMDETPEIMKENMRLIQENS